MAHYGTEGGKRVLAHGALLSCEYSGGRGQFIVWEDVDFHAPHLALHQHSRVTPESPAGKLGEQVVLPVKLWS